MKSQKMHVSAYIGNREATTPDNAKPVLTLAVFRECNAGVAAIINKYRPSGSNGQLGPALDEIAAFFREKGINEEAYWYDVWLRSGKKPLDSYRTGGPQQGIVHVEKAENHSGAATPADSNKESFTSAIKKEGK